MPWSASSHYIVLPCPNHLTRHDETDFRRPSAVPRIDHLYTTRIAAATLFARFDCEGALTINEASFVPVLCTSDLVLDQGNSL